MDREKLLRWQRRANIRFRVMGVILWLSLIVGGIYILVASNPKVIVPSVLLILVGVWGLSTRLYVTLAARRAKRDAAELPRS